jgi:ribosome biogenesis ATPase
MDRRCEGFSGADLAALLRESGLAVIREWKTNHLARSEIESENKTEISRVGFSALPIQSLNKVICARHFELAFSHVRPSVALEDRMRYEKVHELITNGIGAIQALKIARKVLSKKNLDI